MGQYDFPIFFEILTSKFQYSNLVSYHHQLSHLISDGFCFDESINANLLFDSSFNANIYGPCISTNLFPVLLLKDIGSFLTSIPCTR